METLKQIGTVLVFTLYILFLLIMIAHCDTV